MVDKRKVTLSTTVVLALMGVLVGMVLSKYSARAAYDLGYSVATNNIEHEHQIRMTHFAEHRKESCLAWWFNDSWNNLKAAQFYMCQNRKKWQ